jgi:hypothetical protein
LRLFFQSIDKNWGFVGSNSYGMSEKERERERRRKRLLW